jgi:hypothetical protein
MFRELAAVVTAATLGFVGNAFAQDAFRAPRNYQQPA